MYGLRIVYSIWVQKNYESTQLVILIQLKQLIGQKNKYSDKEASKWTSHEHILMLNNIRSLITLLTHQISDN